MRQQTMNIVGYQPTDAKNRAVLQAVSKFFDTSVQTIREEKNTVIFRVPGFTSECALAKLRQESPKLKALIRAEGVMDLFLSFIFFLSPRRDLAVAYDTASGQVEKNRSSELAPPRGTVIYTTDNFASDLVQKVIVRGWD